MKHLITLEGGEGSGKSTLMGALGRLLCDLTPVLVREPGSTAEGTAIREILLDPRLTPTPEAELLLFNAARHCLITSLEQAGHDLVICDRFTDSSLAYQGYGRGLPLAQVRDICMFGAAGRVPDLTLWLDLDPEEGLRRAGRRGEMNRLDHAALEFHLRVREGYRDLARHHPQRVRRIDATAPAEVVAEQAANLIRRHVVMWRAKA